MAVNSNEMPVQRVAFFNWIHIENTRHQKEIRKKFEFLHGKITDGTVQVNHIALIYHSTIACIASCARHTRACIHSFVDFIR